MIRTSKVEYLHLLHQFWDHFMDFTLSLCLAVTCAKRCKGKPKFKQLEKCNKFEQHTLGELGIFTLLGPKIRFFDYFKLSR
jgi:hypothetical protein